MIVFGGLVIAFALFVLSLIASIFITAIAGTAFPKFPQRQVALAISGMLPIMSALGLMTAVLHEAWAGMRPEGVTFLATFGLGAFLALFVAWPLAFRITCKVYSIDLSKDR